MRERSGGGDSRRREHPLAGAASTMLHRQAAEVAGEDADAAVDGPRLGAHERHHEQHERNHAVPDLMARRARHDYSGDLLGTGVIALVLLVMPLVRPEARAVDGGVGVLAGYLGGLAMQRRARGSG